MRDLASRSGCTQGYTVGTRERCKYSRWFIHHPQNKVYRNCIGPGRKGKDGRMGTGFTGTGVFDHCGFTYRNWVVWCNGGFLLLSKLPEEDAEGIWQTFLLPNCYLPPVSLSGHLCCFKCVCSTSASGPGKCSSLSSFSALQAIVMIERKLLFAKRMLYFIHQLSR